MQAVTFNLHGTLAANARGEFILPCGATLEAVSISNSAATAALLDVGISTDRNGIFSAVDCGDSGTPTLFEVADYNGALATAGEPYRAAAGTIWTYDLDFDGASGTAGANVTIVFYFLEG